MKKTLLQDKTGAGRRLVIRLLGILGFVCMSVMCSCHDRKSYAELLSDENKACNAFLADHRVVGSIPADTVFEVGENAPYYQLDDNGDIFMQVLNAGTPGNKAQTDQLIYFRFMRYNLYKYSNGDLGTGEGNNADLSVGNASFRFRNMSVNSSYQWGMGIQTPLLYLPIDCEVNLLIKSQQGMNSEIAYVVPYLYKVRYFKSQI